MIEILLSDNLEALQNIRGVKYNLIYIDPPFNTGIKRTHTPIKTTINDDGNRVGFGGNNYSVTKQEEVGSYVDKFDEDFIPGFLEPRVKEAYRVLADNGSLFLHLDYREVHYAKIMCDKIFGNRLCFKNEIIWSYDYGGRPRDRWPLKHDNILWYAKNPKHYCFNYDEIDRIPYLAPNLVGEDKALRGKTPTDVWWNTIVPTSGKEKTGYPTQKPLGILNRIVKVHSSPGDKLLDFFAGSGSFGEAAANENRDCLLVDSNPDAVEVMIKRFTDRNIQFKIK